MRLIQIKRSMSARLRNAIEVMGHLGSLRFICRKGTEHRVYDSRCPHQVTNI